MYIFCDPCQWSLFALPAFLCTSQNQIMIKGKMESPLFKKNNTIDEPDIQAKLDNIIKRAIDENEALTRVLMNIKGSDQENATKRQQRKKT